MSMWIDGPRLISNMQLDTLARDVMIKNVKSE